MASNQTQNCQRGVVFLNFVIILLFFIMVVVRLVKKLIDPIEEGDARYKEEEGKDNKQENKQAPPPKKGNAAEDTTLNLDELVKKVEPINEDDPTGIKMAKKFEELQKLLFPLVIVFPLNLILGTAYSFLMVDFFFTFILIILVNLAGMHKKCCQNKVVKAILQNLWLFCIFFMFVNTWGARSTRQPYVVIGT